MKNSSFEKTIMWFSALALPTAATFILFLQMNNQKQKIEELEEQLQELSDSI